MLHLAYNLILLIVVTINIVRGCSVINDAAKQARSGTEGYQYADSTKWPEQFPISCGGLRQSPINVDSGNCLSRPGKFRRHLRISGWNDIPQITKVENTGKTVEIWNEYSGRRPQMTGGPFGSEIYEFHQVHFHWGRNDEEGSEHWLASKQYPLEAHFLFINIRYNRNLTAAVSKANGLAAMSRLFEIDSTAPQIEFINLLKNVNATFTSYTEYSKVVTLSMISGSINWKFVSYHGGVTVPACWESVTWLVPVEKTIKLSKQNMAVFRGNKLLEDFNFRAPQPLNGRQFYCGSTSQSLFGL